MEFKGKVRKLLPIRSGTSQRTGNEWRALPFVFEYFEHESDPWPDTVLLETFDDKVIDNLQEGMEVICGFRHRTREYEDRTFNDIRLNKIESIRKAAQIQVPEQPPVAPPPAEPVSQQKEEDLPF